MTGSFPSVNNNEGFLNDTDRENLKKIDIELAKTTLEALYNDNFNIYKASTNDRLIQHTTRRNWNKTGILTHINEYKE